MKRLTRKELRELIHEALASNIDEEKDEIYEAVTEQAELIVDEVMSIWIDRFKQMGSKVAVGHNDWIKQVERASEHLKQSLPLDEIFLLIENTEKQLLNGKFKK